jgi:hypothetical protein
MSRKPEQPAAPESCTPDEVLQMIYSFADFMTHAYGLHSNQITDSQGRPIVLTPTPGILVEQWQASLEAEVTSN